MIPLVFSRYTPPSIKCRNLSCEGNIMKFHYFKLRVYYSVLVLFNIQLISNLCYTEAVQSRLGYRL